MTLIGIGIIIIAVSAAAVAIAMVPALNEVRETARSTREVLERTEQEIRPLIAELKAATADLREMTRRVSAGTESVEGILHSVEEATKGLRTIGTVIDSATGIVSRSSLWLTGAKVAGKFILDRIRERRSRSTKEADHG